MSLEYRQGIAVVVGSLVMALLFATAGRADDQWLSLGWWNACIRVQSPDEAAA